MNFSPYHQELKPEMEILRKAQKKFKSRDGEFLLYIVEKLPPKRPISTPKKKQLKHLSQIELKKLFHKAVLWYHPDKQDIEEHGMKWAVLCEEITKAFTSIYEHYKGI